MQARELMSDPRRGHDPSSPLTVTGDQQNGRLVHSCWRLNPGLNPSTTLHKITQVGVQSWRYLRSFLLQLGSSAHPLEPSHIHIMTRSGRLSP